LPAFLHRVNCPYILSTSPAKLCFSAPGVHSQAAVAGGHRAAYRPDQSHGLRSGAGVPRSRGAAGLVANVFLYYWLRASTINVNVPEPFSQTLECHWNMVVERVAAFVDTLGHRTRS